MFAKLVLEDGSEYTGDFFGSPRSVAGEVVFNTGMVGYPECFTDPSYTGQILILTYPLIGNYGVPKTNSSDPLSTTFESDKIHISGLLVSEYSYHFSHKKDRQNLNIWLQNNDIPAIAGIDTRALTRKLREHGTMLGKMVVEQDRDVDFHDPNLENLVDRVSIERPQEFGEGDKTVLLVHCGCKLNIIRSLVQRDLRVKVVPWDWDLSKEKFDGVVVSNGPGDPKMAETTVVNLKKLMEQDAPIFGICLGNQLLARAAGADTFKLKYGHRSQNQPCIMVGSKRCFITSQNHGLPSMKKPFRKIGSRGFSMPTTGPTKGSDIARSHS